jgi:DMSO reductase anchor subunit
MSESMLKMYISFIGMASLLVAIGLILLARYKLRGWLARIISLFAYISLLLGSLIIFYVVFSGPTG